VWLFPNQFNDVIVRLVGFHIAYNSLPVIGEHFAESGLAEIWIESGLYSQCVAQHMMCGNSRNRSIQAHKLTMEALWRVLFDSFTNWQERSNKSSINELQYYSNDIVTHFNSTENVLNEKLSQLCDNADDLVKDYQEYIQENAANPTFVYWIQYMKIVGKLMFIRAERTGDWKLHLLAFRILLGDMMIYDHTNYSRWGMIYLIDMLQLETKYLWIKPWNTLIKSTK